MEAQKSKSQKKESAFLEKGCDLCEIFGTELMVCFLKTVVLNYLPGRWDGFCFKDANPYLSNFRERARSCAQFILGYFIASRREFQVTQKSNWHREMESQKEQRDMRSINRRAYV